MMITNWFVKKRGLAMSIAMAGIGVGTIFSPVITWLLGHMAGEAPTGSWHSIILVLALPAALFILRKRRRTWDFYPMAVPVRIPP